MVVLVGVFPWDSSEDEREALRKSYETRYEELKLKWVNDDVKRNTEFWKDQKFRIEKDINRTDRNLDLFKNPKRERKIPMVRQQKQLPPSTPLIM